MRKSSELEASSTDSSASNTDFTPDPDSIITSNSDSDDEDPFKKRSEYCSCETEYRGEQDETHCPNCSKIVIKDIDDSGSVDWSVFERNCIITNRLSKSLEDFIAEIEFDFSLKTDLNANVEEEMYFADDENEP